MRPLKRAWLGAICAVLAALGGSVSAQAAAPEPDFVLSTPVFVLEKPPLELDGPCGVAVRTSHSFYVANYHRNSIERISANPAPIVGTFSFDYSNLLSHVDPLDGPCAMSFDSSGRLFVNNYHRNVERYTPSGDGYGPPTVIDSAHPTGIAVDPSTDVLYVNNRTHIAAYDSGGAPLLDGGGEPVRIGEGSLGDGYGLAISRFPATLGRLYVADNADDTVKIYDPLIDPDDPVQTIAGPPGGFGSLRDSAIAVDWEEGEIYVADTLAYPQYSEHPEATIYVFSAGGAHEGRLKYNIVDASPPGLAVDNTAGESQGRVYVTSGNTVGASVYAYPPESATEFGSPASFSLALSSQGEGDGAIATALGGIECTSSCEEEMRAGTQVPLTADPAPGSTFAGWSGGGCEGSGPCTVQMTQARSVSAEFEPAPAASLTASGPAGPPSPPATASVITQKGTLRLTVSGSLFPKRLPRRGTAPISVSVGGRITTTDQSLPPQLKSLRIELNRHGRIEATGLPTCAYDRIQPGSSSRALSACRPALVGKGSFTANITLAGQEPYPTQGRLLVFNGHQGGRPVLFGHIFSANPFATSFVIVFKLQKLGKGTYGTALNAPLPKAMDAWGRLTGLEMTLSRRYSHRGERRSFISAGCPAPKGFRSAPFPLARTSFAFAEGKELNSILTSTCSVRG